MPGYLDRNVVRMIDYYMADPVALRARSSDCVSGSLHRSAHIITHSLQGKGHNSEENTHVELARNGVGFRIGLAFVLPEPEGRMSALSGCSLDATSSSLERQPPRPPVLAMPPPSRI